MPNFKYTALDQNGAEKTGFVTADNKIAAMEMARAQGLLVSECEEVKAGASPSAAKKKDNKKDKGKKKKETHNNFFNYRRSGFVCRTYSVCNTYRS